MADNPKHLEAWREALSSTKDCLSLDTLRTFLEQSTPDSRDAHHLAVCPHCQAELAMIRSFESSAASDDEGAAAAWIAGQLQRMHDRTPSLPLKPPLWRSFFKLPYLVAAAALLLIIGLVTSLFISEHHQQTLISDISGPQTMRSAAVRLTSPSGEVAQIPKEFRWEPFQGAASYSVQLLEVDGSILGSGETQQNVFPVSPELGKKIQNGKPLLWKVIAFSPSGSILAVSNREPFRVKMASHNRH